MESILELPGVQCTLGENPLVHPVSGNIFWTDIEAGKVFTCSPDFSNFETVYSGPKVGGFTFQKNDELLLFRENNIAVQDKNRKVRILKTQVDRDMVRFNDVIADPRGRVFAGTIGRETDGKKTGGLYRIDLDGSVTRLFQGTLCANGMGFSPKADFFYWNDSTANKTFRFPYSIETGNLGEPNQVFSLLENEGVLDGLTIDAQGQIWVAVWGGGKIMKLSPKGKVQQSVFLPTPKITSLTFGSQRPNDLFVTSASKGETGPHAGRLFKIPGAGQGLPENLSQITRILG